MKPYTNHYVNPLHVDDPERDPFSVPADHRGPDSTASHRPAARFTVQTDPSGGSVLVQGGVFFLIFVSFN
jgi:hypothetical protein